MLGAMAQASYTFNAVALNVDGLPNQEINAVITTVNLNKDGKNEAGATELCDILANSGWDIVGLSEDFNFHSYLAAEPASTYYNFGKHSGGIETTLSQAFDRADIDGLGLAVAKRFSFTGDTSTGLQVQWETEYGGSGLTSIGDNGADNMITKGFRMYTVTIATGVAVDVYVLHMDASTADSDDDYDNGKDKNVVAREAQLSQLATYIKNNHNNRPVIILGDTNCRYTREALKTGFIDVINADSRFTIKDAWVEHMWGGEFPTYGGDALMTHTYGDQKGEVVDKVFYINTTESNLTLKANSYLHDKSFSGSDHWPVVVNFTLTDPNGTPVEAEFPGPDSEVVLTDGSPTNPTVDLSGTYYLKNVYSGLYLKNGMMHSTQAAEGVHAMPITLKKVGNNYTYSAAGTIGYLGADYYMDQGEYNWAVKEIVRSDGAKKYMFLHADGTALSPDAANTGAVIGATYNAADTKQHWMLYTIDDIKEEMEETLSGAACNVSMFIPYGLVTTSKDDTRKGEWKGDPTFTGWRGNGSAAMEKHGWGWEPDLQVFDVYQEISNLPSGTYTLTAQAFHRDGDHGTSSTTVYPELYATNGSSKTFSTKVCSINDPSGPSEKPNDLDQAADALFPASAYNVTLSNITVNSDGKLRVGIRNTTAHDTRMWCCFNNFQLLYHGTAQGDLKGTAVYKEIKTAAEEAQALMTTQSAEAQKAFDITNVAYRYNNNLISADGAWELATIDNAVKTAVASQTTIGADMSLLIENNSFEKGNTTGWSIAKGGSQTDVRNDGTANTDGGYLFNTWSGWNDYGCGMIYQDITGLRNGYYKLNALVASWGHQSVYLMGNKQYASIATTAGDATFVDFGLDFLVEDGTARIGAVGAGNEGGFYFRNGVFFKADNFRLSYMGTTGEGRVKFALADAKAKAAKLHEAANNQFLAAVAKYENAAVTGDGTTEEAAIYNALKAAIATQPRTETDMTWMITNPGFETGDWTGWEILDVRDERVAHATDGVAPGNVQGQYMVNVWNDAADATNSGINPPVYQTLSGLPNGRYRLTADVTSDGGNQVCVYATTSSTVNGAASPDNNWTFVKASVDFEVTGNQDVTIGAVGYRNGAFNIEGGCWYKCDNFRLTFLGHEGSFADTGDLGTLDDWYTKATLNRTIKKGKWATFVCPFDIPASYLAEWDIKELDPANSVLSGDKITIQFIDATDGIKAGVPYMVRNTTMADDLTSITMENVQVNATANDTENEHVEFVGTYKSMKVPQGAYFISDNTFYQAADDSNSIKAFRAYFTTKPAAAHARSLSYRFAGNGDGEGTTAIDSPDGEPTVVGIYTLGGVRINDMQQGVNILQMSDGSVIKVVIK